MIHQCKLKEFRRFLKKEGAYEDYLKNLKAGADYRCHHARIQKIDEIEWLTATIKKCPQNLILDAFRWEGCQSVMWQELNTKWQEKN